MSDYLPAEPETVSIPPMPTTLRPAYEGGPEGAVHR
jgi:hypothetical protein